MCVCVSVCMSKDRTVNTLKTVKIVQEVTAFNMSCLMKETSGKVVKEDNMLILRNL